MCSVLSAIVLQLFPTPGCLEICDHQDFPSVLEKDINCLTTNSTYVISINVHSLVMKLYTIKADFLAKTHNAGQVCSLYCMNCLPV